MKREGAFFRGEPAVALTALLVGWALLRVAFWEPLPGSGLPISLAAPESARNPAVLPMLESPSGGMVARTAPSLARTKESATPTLRTSGLSVGHLRPVAVASRSAGTAGSFPSGAPNSGSPGADASLIPHSAPGSATAQANDAITQAAPYPVPPIGAPAVAPARRWSGDAWLLVRQDTTAPLSAGRPSYGRSQMGAVLRYRLAPSSAWRPTVHARASKALDGVAESEFAAGVSVRPIPALPVSLAAEMRAFDSSEHSEIRPAAFAVTELPPIELPAGLRGETYIQGGYVGGAHATAFVDGQARLERKLLGVQQVELRVGAGAWGGAQKGGERLDVGPTASLSFGLGAVQARLAADWRFRVGGNAEPSSGPTMTIVAGF